VALTNTLTGLGGVAARDASRVSPDIVNVATDPAVLPDMPRESHGLFELVPKVARRALELGLAAREPSFHVFVAAQPDVMIDDDVVRYAERFARKRPTPSDIVYVHDFDRPEAPIPLALPAGVGPALVDAMDELVERLAEQMPSIVQSDEVRSAQRAHAAALEAQNKVILHELEITAKTLGFGVRPVQGGVQTFPILHGKPVSAEQFDVLDESTKRALAEAEERLTREVEKAARRVRDESAHFDEARKEALTRAAEALIDAALADVVEKFAPLGEDVAGWLARVREALCEDWEDLVGSDSGDKERGGDGEGEAAADHDPELARRLMRFKVNLFVAREPGSPAPVVYETNPTYPHLFGYLERRARFGALLTDFTRIRAGSLHRASGGVLVVRAADVLADPIIWDRLKRVLRERRIGAEDPLGPLGLYATTLRPVPVPIRTRVVLVGSPDLYATLLDADPDFASLFRVKVEVEPSIARTEESMIALDAYLMQLARERDWGVFDKAARARLLDLATRIAGDRQKLALSLSPLEETAAFASALAAARTLGGLDEEDDHERREPRGSGDGSGAGLDGDVHPDAASDDAGQVAAPSERPEGGLRESLAPTADTRVTVEDVDLAWRERRDRLGAAERHIREITLRGEVALDTTGQRVGVVNGLSVFSTGDVEFGQPMRITAVVALGREGIIDVEREAQLGGSVHTKGVAILRGYLARLFGQERPLSLRAQLAFEQSYGEIDGDSASSSELYAVLSALADVGIDQGVAVTGSVNQLGEMQAIGGLCAKIEGFFDLCNARGLTGAQGVLLPRANLPHLVLRDDVARAIKAGRFHLYAVEDAAQGIAILTGLPAGERDAAGRFPASSVFGRVERRLIEIAERLREAEGHGFHEVRDAIEDAQAEGGNGADFRTVSPPGAPVPR
jgi:predicted ATP-dependent protease